MTEEKGAIPAEALVAIDASEMKKMTDQADDLGWTTNRRDHGLTIIEIKRDDRRLRDAMENVEMTAVVRNGKVTENGSDYLIEQNLRVRHGWCHPSLHTGAIPSSMFQDRFGPD